jgi:acyl transferase domain-containing protein/surfactin synthase thioesterase subunit/acyl carrier protein
VKTSPEQIAEALRVSLKETERLRQRNRRLQEEAGEPIAIVGMSCRLPGGADSPQQLWELLARGDDAVAGFPTDRGWRLDELYDAELGMSYIREGGFLQRATEFDNEFFGISPAEALGMNAQERLLLEAAWEVLEDAGLKPDSLRGSPTGVFAGTMYYDYGWGLDPIRDPTVSVSTASSSSSVPGRISYTLGLEGPSLSVDTACSSSLVALHLAVQALRGGECELALAGGATVYSTPMVFVQFGRQRALSPDGRCKSFAEGADGAGFSEGVGMLLLERLSDARRNGHRILATIRGSAVNQDGASNGMTAPNGPAQERVIRQALENARLTAADVEAIEAHGTGTALGDPIEAGALMATYGAERPAGSPLLLGSIKSNVGHPQAAAGVAGVIKMVLALQHELLPQTLHVERPSSNIDWSASEVELLTEARPWPRAEGPRRAGVSSFGATGTNAHLILEEAPAQPAGEGRADERPAPPPLPGVVLLPLSARSEPALREQADRLAAHLESRAEVDALDAAYSLATTRTAFKRRATIVARDRESLLAGLAGLGEEEEGGSVARGSAVAGKVAYVFSGHGGHWPTMGAELLDASPVFADAIEACEEALLPYVDWSLREVLREEDGSSLERAEVVQPALFAVMVSLAQLWRKCGVEPAVVLGHSSGEIAAAHVAGGLSLEDAALLVTVRSRLIARLFGLGALAWIALGADRLQDRLREWDGRIEVAALNGPGSAMVTGETAALEELLEWCEAEGVRTRRMRISMASHSKQVEVLREELLEAIAPISPRSGEIPFHSTVTGERIDTAELGPEYWYGNLRRTVRLEPVVRELLGEGLRTLIEVGPHPVLGTGLQETVEAAAESPDAVAVVPSLRRGNGSAERFALSLAQAQVNGAPLDWEAIFAGSGASRVPLPTYPFQGRRFWLSGASAGDPASIGQSDLAHPLLGAKIEDPRGAGFSMTGRISLADRPWLADHALGGTFLLPGTALLELALVAAREAGSGGVAELTLQAPIVVPEQGSIAVQVSVAGGEEGKEVLIHSRLQEAEDAEWQLSARGLLSAAAGDDAGKPLEQWPPEGAAAVDPSEIQDRLAQAGWEYGPALQGLRAAWREGENVWAEISLAEEQAGEAERYAVHPALLDGALQALSLFDRGEAGAPRYPAAFAGVSLSREGARELRVALSTEGEETTLRLFDSHGAPVGSVASLAMRELDDSLLARDRGGDLLGVVWEEVSLAERGAAPDAVWRLGVDCEVGDPQEAATAALRALQDWLGRDQPASARLTVLTEAGVAVHAGEAADPAAAAVWGLVRSAQNENPGRFALVDVDGSEASQEALAAAIELAAEEPQLALREGLALVPRLRSLSVEADGSAGGGRDAVARIEPERTVLITGGTGALGSLVARHLVAEHGARHLLLVSRSGAEAAGAEELRQALEDLDAEVRVVACDLSDRKAVGELLESISTDHPLGAVVHAASVLEDATISSLEPSQFDRVFAAAVQSARHLDELTREADLSTFLILTSAAGVLGTPGRGNGAAAAATLEALAARRRGDGLPAAFLALGPWTAADTPPDPERAARVRRFGFEEMSQERLLANVDAVLTGTASPCLASALEKVALRKQAGDGTLLSILGGLVRAPLRPRSGGALAARLASTPESEHESVAIELVRAETAAVLGLSSPTEVDVDRAFLEMGMDSLGAVELRNRLTSRSGLRLPTTVVFDHPSVTPLARFMLGQVAPSQRPANVARRVRADRGEPIAIVGMACRFPGGARSPRQLWQLLESGRDAISDFPTDRGWDVEALYHPDPDHPGTTYVREGGFLPDFADFDPTFFGISPREAEAMDPQQRQLLEICWEAVESAGIAPDRLRGSDTGVFVGGATGDFGSLIDTNGSLFTGSTSSVLSGRISYSFGFEGPAVTVDTACSSSLVALHLGARALREGECSRAVAGGVALYSTPVGFVDVGTVRGLAPDARCKAFAESADGTGFSEGVGLVVLEPLSEARRQGHEVLATIRGSAINQDGASNGLTAPNGPSQERVIRQALADAGLAAADVDAVEAHGTGTALGDPIEASALLATYGQEREQPVLLGSIKSNIGHAASAAGIAGVIKMTMALREGLLPKTLHVDRPSSKIDWSAGKVELLEEARTWEANGRPRRAAVSSFGMSGTNAHLILEQAPAAAADDEGEKAESPPAPWSTPVPIPLSAKTEAALVDSAARLRSHLEAQPELEAVDVSRTMASGRTAFAHRAVVLAAERAETLDALGALAANRGHPAVVRGVARGERSPVFVFPGQGGQWRGMAAELMAESPVFAAKMAEAREALEPHLSCSFDAALQEVDEATPAEQLDVVQPLLFAVTVSLAELWRAAGVRPAAIVGQSQGEVAAAYVAGGLSLEDAARIVVLRSRILARLAGAGKLISVRLGAGELDERLAGCDGLVEVAGITGPFSAVLAGDGEALDEFARRCEADGVKVKDIPGVVPSHSALVDPLKEEMLEALAPISPRSGRIPFHSTVTGGVLDTAELDAEYWYRNARQTVLLEPVLRSLLEQGHRSFLEISPHPVLALGLQATIEDVLGSPEEAVALHTLRRGEGGPQRFARSFAEAQAAGVKVDWDTHLAARGGKLVELPTYPFQRRRYWPSVRRREPGPAGVANSGHPLLEACVEDPADGSLILSGSISTERAPWLGDRVLDGTVVVPGAVFAELALEAAARAGAASVAELDVEVPLPLEGDRAVPLRVSVGAEQDDGSRRISIHSCPAQGGDVADVSPARPSWTCHARGTLAAAGAGAPEPPSKAPWPPEGAKPLDVELLYDRLADAGLEIGPAFRTLRAAWEDEGELVAELALDDVEEGEGVGEGAGLRIHPALLEGALDLALGADLEGDSPPVDSLELPATWRGLRVVKPGAEALRVRVSRAEGCSSLLATGRDGRLVGAVDSVAGRVSAPSTGRTRPRRSLYRLEWVEPSLPSTTLETRFGLLGSDGVDLPGAGHFADLDSLIAAVESGEAAPDVVAVDCTQAQGALPGSAHDTARRALELVQRWSGASSLRETKLVFLTAGALAPSPDEGFDLTTAPLAGLIHTASHEHFGRFALVDVEGGGERPWLRSLPAALALGDEPLLALRGEKILVPRLSRAQSEGGEPGASFDPGGTVLIAGGTGRIGASIARHLAAEHGVRHLLLVGRQGNDSPGAAAIEAELRELGAETRIAACDVSDRDQLGRLLEAIPPERPLRAVIHAAAVHENGAIESFDGERLERAMRPKVDGAWNLHELTSGLDLSQFILFSTISGAIGVPGQVSFAGGSAFLDALARHRRQQGLPAISMAWGKWAQGDVDETYRTRMLRLGLDLTSPEEGLELFDAAVAAGEPLSVPASIRRSALREQARNGMLPAVFRRLVSLSSGATSRDSLRDRLTAAPAEEREAVALDFVRAQIAAVLGFANGGEVEPDRNLQEMGFDSLGAVELRHRLSAAAGVRVPMTAVADRPTAAGIATSLLTRFAAEDGGEEEVDLETGSGYVGLLGAARDDGALEALVERLERESQLRATFDVPAGPGDAPRPVRLAEGGEDAPGIVLLPSTGPLSGPHEYVTLANALPDERTVLTLPLPGFVEGEKLPATVEALVEAAARAIDGSDLPRPFLVAGHSSGGWIAHALVNHLESVGAAPAGLVLLDTYPPDSPLLRGILPLVLAMARDGAEDEVNDTRLTAMGAYRKLIAEWEPTEISTPTVLIRASEPSSRSSRSARDWRATWMFPHSLIDVPGDHLTMMTSNVSTTAEAIFECSNELLQVDTHDGSHSDRFILD